MKLRNVQAYPIKDVPDHLVEECHNLGKHLSFALLQECIGKHPNIILGAMCFAHAAMIKHFISDDKEQVEKAGQSYAIALLKNLDTLIEAQEKGNID